MKEIEKIKEMGTEHIFLMSFEIILTTLGICLLFMTNKDIWYLTFFVITVFQLILISRYLYKKDYNLCHTIITFMLYLNIRIVTNKNFSFKSLSKCVFPKEYISIIKPLIVDLLFQKRLAILRNKR